MTAPHVVRRVRANHLDRPGTETAALLATESGWRLSGLARIEYPEGPGVVRYRIDADRAWKTRTARIDLHLGPLARSVRIATQPDGRWHVGGMEQRDLRGCVDLDLTATAMTNTLPIRRLGLPVGSAATVPVAWMTFPDLEIHPVHQIYTRIAEDRYRYEAPHNRFSAEFTVDASGIVVDYPEYWTRRPPARRARPGRPDPGRRGGLSNLK